ncbi:MAG: sigma-54 dependent transcriptional regulator [Planctomycetota bacterium]
MPLTAVNPTSTVESLTSLPATHQDAWVLGDTPRVRQLARHAERAAEVQCTVLLSGETGTGKELWAKALHSLSPRREAPFVPVNCAALTATLAESQLFGHEKGAFTGAAGKSFGVFRAAQGGVVFLDEVGEMPLELQPKLLRALQENEVTPVGAAHPQKISVQVVAATNRDLEVEVAEGRFREDLYYRLNMVELQIPSLRQRIDDLPKLIDFFAERYAAKYSRPRWQPAPETLADFCNYPWPGNIRQLAHVIEQGYVLDCEPMLPNQRGGAIAASQLPVTDLATLRSMAVDQAMRATRGHKGRAAKLLGVHPNTMTRLLAGRAEQN